MRKSSFASFWDSSFNELRVADLDCRWVTPDHVLSVLSKLPNSVFVEEIGKSAEGRLIHKLTIGSGNKPVLAWAAMHGNESTALRGWLDLFANLENDTVKSHLDSLLQEFTIHFIPLLNPDGAQRYTRRNAMEVDMNRDARNWQTPEMRILKQQIETIKPVLAFNLHDQRNIFTVNGRSATISFLAPSMDAGRSLTSVRERSMGLIGAAAEVITQFIPGQIGRYTDEFYPTAIGEFVQKKEVPTILVECGAAYNDPLRQVARKLNPIILHAVLEQFTSFTENNTSIYNAIPVNESNQVDILIKGIQREVFGIKMKADLALLVEEKIENGKYTRILKVLDFGDLGQLVGLENFAWIATKRMGSVTIGDVADFYFETKEGQLLIEHGKKINPTWS